MAQSLWVEELIREVQTEISLLHQLCILAQTESLVLERGDFEGLDLVVAKKLALVENLNNITKRVDTILASTQTPLGDLQSSKRELLRSMGVEGSKLLELIRKVDSENRTLLEESRSWIVRQSHQVQQDFSLRKAYQSLPASQVQCLDLAD